MIPINIQVSRLKVKVRDQTILNMLKKGGISVSQTSIFVPHFRLSPTFRESLKLIPPSVCQYVCHKN